MVKLSFNTYCYWNGLWGLGMVVGIKNLLQGWRFICRPLEWSLLEPPGLDLI